MVQEYVSPVRVHKYPFEMVMANIVCSSRVLLDVEFVAFRNNLFGHTVLKSRPVRFTVVTTAYERRFPHCPQIPVVIDCSITDDSWSADDSQRYTTRRCQLNVDAPYLLKKMIGVDYIYFIQKNHLDLRNRVLEIEATNETFSARIGVLEKCRYYVHPENPEWTCFEQSALLDVKNFFGLENTVEKIAMKQYASNIAKGKELIESFMQEVFADGVTELQPWVADQPAQNRELRRIVSRGAEPLSPLPAQDLSKHSQPGTSRLLQQSASKLSSQRSGRNLKSRSKSATKLGKDSVQDISNIRLRSKSSGHRKLDPSNAASEIELDRREDTKASSTRLRFMPEMIKTSKSLLSLGSSQGVETKRVTLNEPYLSPANSEMSPKTELKACPCELGTRAALGQFLYQNCLAALAVFLVVLILLLSLPMTLTYRDTPAHG
ncbi:Protein real-time [Papilio machaon]|uniref:Protein real-time n=1 Tax=Papilio machaon TaxID=76193 RepID=A0A194RDV3_PAPMA|nr:Protein real-time [Papilio machaon]